MTEIQRIIVNTLQLASNATVAGAATVSGTIHFVGTQAAEATAWLIAKANAGNFILRRYYLSFLHLLQ